MRMILEWVYSLLSVDIRIDIEILCSGGEDGDIIAGA